MNRTKEKRMAEDDMSTTQESPITMVPVPTHLLGVVYRALGEAMNPSLPSPEVRVVIPAESDSEPSVRVDTAQGDWTRGMLNQLRARLTHAGARAVLDLAARKTPAEVTLIDVLNAVDIPINTTRAQLGAMTKIVKNLFGRSTWPVSIRYNETGTAYYSMNETIARWWLDGR
jgi:hypothetical protein